MSQKNSDIRETNQNCFLIIIINIESPKPKYKGGEKALYEFLGKNIKIPLGGKKGELKCYVFFTITKEGNVTNLRIEKCENELIQKEILRVFSIMPKWIPAKHNGENIECPYAMPINIKY